MDVLYILGKGSPFYNDELKYSLRSLERFGKNIDRLILVGEKPSFLNYSKVVHLPFTEVGVKEYRIASKILHACDKNAVQGDFLFCNDDFFFTKDFDAETLPAFQRGKLLEGEPKSLYQEHLKLTRDYLLAKGRRTLHFDAHCPIVYNAALFQKLRWTWSDSAETIGLVVKSTYCNMNYITGPLYEDVKLRHLITPEDFALAESGFVFSIYDEAWLQGVQTYLQTNFKEKSKWEL